MRRFVVAGLFAASAVLGLTAGANAQDQEVKRSGSTYYVDSCPRQVGLVAHCTSKLVTDVHGNPLQSRDGQRISGWGAQDLRSAYNITTDGSSSTIIALVDAFGYDNAEADLQIYRTNYGLPTCTTENGCFKKLNQKGQQKNYPAQNNGWAGESALDVDMASAMCPNCQIWLVEANTNSFKNLAKAVDWAAANGVHVISNSYAGGDSKGAVKFEPSYDHPGVAITASSDDAGYGAATPASMPHVIAVGGTHLVKDSSTRGWTETAWRGAGSGCSKNYDKPSWQTDKGCKTRMEADVSAVADPATGVAFYGPNSSGVSGWFRTGGTSVAAPLVGGIYANKNGAVSDGSTLYAHVADLYDAVGGSNGTCKGGKKAYFCTAVVGYDGPTGLGTPNGTAAFGD
jgi:subtilase family serine protease